MNKSHEDLQSLLPFFVANQLTANEQQMIEQHLLQCSECYASFNEWQQIAEAVQLRAQCARSLPLLRVPQPTLPLQRRLAFMGLAVLSIGLLLILLMQQLVFVQPQYTNRSASYTERASCNIPCR